MKKNNLSAVAVAIATLVITGSCTNEAIDSNGKQHKTDNKIEGAIEFSTGVKAEPTQQKVVTRTSMTNHSYLGTADFMWEQGDNIWVENGGIRTQSASSNITGTQATARFYVPGNYPGTSYKVYYTGGNATNGNNVTIATEQTQNKPNDPKHIGIAGDCGTATATREGGRFKFMLDHKASYLCFVPRLENTELAPNVYLTKITVTSNNNIAGNYTLDFDQLSGTGNSKQITLITKGSGTVPGPWDKATNKQSSVTAPGFPLGTQTNVATNAAYMVIAPGTHQLTVVYTFKDPATEVEGTYTQVLPSVSFLQNKVYDVTVNLDPKNYYTSTHSMWDAKALYWTTNAQPFIDQMLLPGMPQQGDNRYAREGDNDVNAKNNAAVAPSVNGMSHYVWHGDPHWDNETIWSMLGHLYKGGMWFKKKSAIPEYTEANYKGTDYKYYYWQPGTNRKWTEGDPAWKTTPKQGKPSNTSNYFFLPAMGYLNGEGRLLLKDSEYFGAYWTSTAATATLDNGGVAVTPWVLHFSNTAVGIEQDASSWGYIVGNQWFK